MTKRDFPPIHPGEILLEDFLKPMQISQYHLAQAVGVPLRCIHSADWADEHDVYLGKAVAGFMNPATSRGN